MYLYIKTVTWNIGKRTTQKKKSEVKLVEEKEVKGEKTKIWKVILKNEMKSIEKEIIENNIRSKNKWITFEIKQRKFVLFLE